MNKEKTFEQEVKEVAHNMINEMCMKNIPFAVAMDCSISSCNIILTDLEDNENLIDKYKFWCAVKIELHNQK